MSSNMSLHICRSISWIFKLFHSNINISGIIKWNGRDCRIIIFNFFSWDMNGCVYNWLGTDNWFFGWWWYLVMVLRCIQNEWIINYDGHDHDTFILSVDFVLWVSSNSCMNIDEKFVTFDLLNKLLITKIMNMGFIWN